MKKEQKEKIAIYALAGIIFLTTCWFMFSPTDNEQEKNETFKTELPDGTSKPLADSKREAYDQQHTSGKRDAMRDFSSMYDLTSDTTSSNQSAVRVEREDIFRDAKKANSQVADMQAAMVVDQEYQNLVQEKLLLERELAKKEIQQREAAIQEQQRLTDELMRQAHHAQKDPQPETHSLEEDNDAFSKHAQKTASVANNTVSSLAGQPAELTVERQHGFNTPIGTGYELGANTIRACIHEEQTLTDGQRVKLRLLEALRAGSVTLPAGHVISGVTRLQKDRLEILINSVEYKGNIIPVAMTVYDTDGSSGIYCPGSEELNAMKEATANIGSSLGSSISFASSAGQQIAMDVTRGIITGGSQYLSKKLRVVKVTLKENYQVLLLPKKK